jgi:quercetin dioxygenase-like cupin family protein
MLPKKLLLLLVAGLALAGPARAQDVMTVASNHYRVLVDNEQVRVVENTLQPGEKDPLHTHPAGWYYVTRPGQMRVVFASGKSEIWEPKAGEAGWSPGEGAHTSENVGNAPMSYVLVELKARRVASQRPKFRVRSLGSH